MLRRVRADGCLFMLCMVGVILGFPSWLIWLSDNANTANPLFIFFVMLPFWLLAGIVGVLALFFVFWCIGTVIVKFKGE